MKDEIDGWGNTITSRVPVISKSGCLTIVAITVFLLVIIGFAIGYGSRYLTMLCGNFRDIFGVSFQRNISQFH
jgi:hypothetical protein